MNNIYIPACHTRNMPTNWTPVAVVHRHLPHAELDFERSQVRDGLLHWAQLMEAATSEAATELVRNSTGDGPVFDGPATPCRLETAGAALAALLRTAILHADERACTEDLLGLCRRYQARLLLLRRAMHRADNTPDVVEDAA